MPAWNGLMRVVSGGQTGVGQAALRAAKATGLETGGFSSQGWETEDGPAPSLAEYGLKECPSPGRFRARLKINVEDSDGTLWYGITDTPGYRTAHAAARRGKKPFLAAREGVARISNVVAWAATHKVTVLHVAGNAESRNQGIGERAEVFLTRAFNDPTLRNRPSSLANEVIIYGKKEAMERLVTATLQCLYALGPSEFQTGIGPSGFDTFAWAGEAIVRALSDEFGEKKGS